VAAPITVASFIIDPDKRGDSLDFTRPNGAELRWNLVDRAEVRARTDGSGSTMRSLRRG
jgi:hypothetical protein